MKPEIYLQLAKAVKAYEAYSVRLVNKVSLPFNFVGIVAACLWYSQAYRNLSAAERMKDFESSSFISMFNLDLQRPLLGFQIFFLSSISLTILHWLSVRLCIRLYSYSIAFSECPYLYACDLLSRAGGGIGFGSKERSTIFSKTENHLSNKDTRVAKFLRQSDGFFRQILLSEKRTRSLQRSLVEFKKVNRSDQLNYGPANYYIAIIYIYGFKSNDQVCIREHLEIAVEQKTPMAAFELAFLLLDDDAIKEREHILSLFAETIQDNLDVFVKDIARHESALLLKTQGSLVDLKMALVHLDGILDTRMGTLPMKRQGSHVSLQALSMSGESGVRQAAFDLRIEISDLFEAARHAEAEMNIQRARQEESRQMISFLSHTLISATTGLSNTVRRIAINMISAGGASSLQADAERLAAQVVRMSRVESLVEVFKLYTSDPDTLRLGWSHDSGGEATVLQVAAMAIQQSLLRFYFSPDHESDFERLLPDVEYSTASREFIQDVLALEMTHPNSILKFIDWMRLRLPFLKFTFEGAESIHIGRGGARDVVIFSLVSEFLMNALKYAARNEPITLSLAIKGEFLEVASSNVLNPNAAPPLHSGKSGLTFIRHVCKLLDARFEEPVMRESIFSIGVMLPIK